MYFGEMARNRSQSSAFDRDKPFDDMQPVMAGHAADFCDLSPLEKAKFTRKAVDYRAAFTSWQKAETNRLRVEVDELTKARDKKFSEHGILNHVHSCAKFSEDELERMLQDIADEPGVGPNERCQNYADSAPQPLDAREEDAFEDVCAELPPQCLERPPVPDWVKLIAHNREAWYDTAVGKPGESDVLYMVVIAKQSPVRVYFLRLTEHIRVLPSDASHLSGEACYMPFGHLTYSAYPICFLPESGPLTSKAHPMHGAI